MKSSNLVRGAVRAAETVRLGRASKKRYSITLALPSKHFRDAIKAEAAVRRMSVNSFLRSMIRGYFGAA